MAKKTAVAKKPEAPTTAEHTKQLVEAIATVRSLQDFIKEQRGLESALGTVTRVSDLVTMTGSFGDLRAALEIVGREESKAEVRGLAVLRWPREQAWHRAIVGWASEPVRGEPGRARRPVLLRTCCFSMVARPTILTG